MCNVSVTVLLTIASRKKNDPINTKSKTMIPQYKNACDTPRLSIRLPFIYLKIKLPIPYADTDIPEISPFRFGNHLIKLDSDVI